jgi:predicted RNA binding protein YcfA (HicA-like mRNA interferase family)
MAKVREIIRRLEDDGWFLVGTRGSHRQYKPSDDLAPGTLDSILKQPGLKGR